MKERREFLIQKETLKDVLSQLKVENAHWGVDGSNIDVETDYKYLIEKYDGENSLLVVTEYNLLFIN